jgi:NACalpha-BTF3-like transcription factor
MGTDRDGLVNQAMFMFARLNGFLLGAGVAAPPAAAAQANGSAKANGAATPASPPASRPGPPVPSQVGAKPVAGPGTSRPPPPRQADAAEDPARREVAERVLETAAELERLIKGKNNADADEEEEEQQDEVDAPAEDVDGVGEDMDVADEPAVDEEEEEAPAEEGGALYLMNDGGEMDKIVKDRFVIGRGKHCDFVINSGKVSREHAVIVREGSDFFIEDLGSSNGTWFNKQRIKRRKIEDGDEYFICSEKIKLVMR